MEDAHAWWERKRPRYNVAVVSSGIIAFVLYATIVATTGSRGVAGEADVSVFTLTYQLLGLVAAVALANAAYTLGRWFEIVFRPMDIRRYRRMAYTLGVGVSVMVPFVLPVLVLVRWAGVR